MGRIDIQIKGFPLIKFQDNDKIEKFQKGTMYMKSLEYYRKRERETGDTTVGDAFEAMLHVPDGKLIVPEAGEEIELGVDNLIPTTVSNSFVFCMFGIENSTKAFKFCEAQKKELRSFGDTALLITDRNEFVRRVNAAVEKQKLTCHCGFVTYYDETVNHINLYIDLMRGMHNIAFWKRKMYKGQQEYRFLFENVPVEAGKDYYELDIGSIKDISVVLPTTDVLNAMAAQMEGT